MTIGKLSPVSGEQGFTLIEVLVSIGLFVTIATISSTLFITILKNTSKTNVDQSVKQEGDYALSIITRMARNARQVIDCGEGTGDQIEIQTSDEQLTVFSCHEDGYLASNGARLTSNRVQLDACSFLCQPGGNEFEPDQIVINFSLSDTSGSTRPEEQASLDFTANVTVRNF